VLLSNLLAYQLVICKISLIILWGDVVLDDVAELIGVESGVLFEKLLALLVLLYLSQYGLGSSVSLAVLLHLLSKSESPVFLPDAFLKLLISHTLLLIFFIAWGAATGNPLGLQLWLVIDIFFKL
jgi:hypothetical protein